MIHVEQFEKHEIRKARSYLYEIQYLDKNAKKIKIESSQACFDDAIARAKICGAIQIISCVQKH